MPPVQMKDLFEQCGASRKWLVKIFGGTHNDSWQMFPEFYYKVSNTVVTCRTYELHEVLVCLFDYTSMARLHYTTLCR